MSEEIYLDKIRLGAVIVQKELDLIGVYNSLLKDLRERPELINCVNEYDKYYIVWQHLAELWDFLKNDYIKKLEKKERDTIVNTMDRYKNNLPLNLVELKDTKDIVLKIMSLSKFHDIVRKGEMRGLSTVTKRFKLEKE